MSRIYVAASAKRHRVSGSRIRTALRNAGMPVAIVGDKMYFIGRDSRGIELELVVVPWPKNDDHVMVIHAMPASWRHL